MWSIQRHIYGTEFQRFWDERIARGEAGAKRPTMDRWKSKLPPSPDADRS
jgi:hypothetical protein